MKTRIALSLSLLCSITGSAQDITFDLADPHPVIDGAIYGVLEFGDIDADGDMDLFVSGRTDGGFGTSDSKIYLNDGDGNFSEDESVIIEELESTGAKFADLDMDGDLDLLINGYPGGWGGYAGLYLNDGLGQFELQENLPFEPTGGGDIAIGDVDGDGDLDVLLSGYGDIYIVSEVFLNDGNAGFTAVDSALVGVAGQAEFADLDGDGDLDLLSAGHVANGSGTRVHINDGAGIFTPVEFPFPDVQDESFAIGDLDNDGDLDVLISGVMGLNPIVTELYLNDGSGNFTEIEDHIFPIMRRGQTRFVDFDVDGDLDVLMTGTYSGGGNGDIGIMTKIFENQGNMVFQQADSLIGCNVTIAGVADINGDQLPDFMLSGFNDDELAPPTWVYLNSSDVNVGLTEFDNNYSIEVYPSPASGSFSVRLPEAIMGRIEIYSTTGQLVYQSAINGSQHEVSLDVASGIYSLILRSESELRSRSIVIEH